MKPCEHATLTPSPQGAFVLDTRTGTCFALNAVGVEVWNGLKNGRSTDEIVSTLVGMFDEVPRTKIVADVATFIRALESRNLVTP